MVFILSSLSSQRNRFDYVSVDCKARAVSEKQEKALSLPHFRKNDFCKVRRQGFNFWQIKKDNIVVKLKLT
jgi:hypothetical protein